MKTKAVIIIFFIIACISAYARPRYSFTNYTRDNGTGQMVVQDILQDNNGYLWLAAWSGLHRFNGSSFTDYRVEGTDDNGNQASNHFLDIENDAFGRIWVLAYDKRLYRFDPHESSMTTADDGMKMEGMFRLASDDFIFLSSDNVLFRTDYGKGGRDCAIVRYLELAPDTEVNGALKDIYDNVWVLTDKGLYRNRQLVNERPALCFEELDNAIYFGSTDGKIVEYIEGKEFLLDTYTDYEIRLIANVPGTLEFIVGSSTDGLIALNFEGWTSTPVKWESYRDGKLRAIKDDESNVWIYSERGSLDWYDSSLKELVPFYDKKRQKEWNSERYVHSAFSDNQGNIWFSPSYGGIERAVLNTENFRLETITNTSAISPENSVRAIYLDKGIKYVATKDGKVRLYNDQWATLAVWNTIDPVYSITKTKDGTVWLGTKGGGLIENRSGAYNLTAYHPERYRKNDLLFYSVNGDLIYHLNSEDEDRLWIGSFDGSIYYLDLGKDRRDFISKKNLISFPTDQLNRVRHICFGPNGSLYAGGTLGLFILDAPTTAPQDMQFKSFPSVKGYNIHHIMFSRSGQMYASSFGNGFLHFHSTDSGSGVTAYTTNEGLLSNYVYSAIEDKHGNIWLATHGGLNRLNPDTGSIIGFPYERIGVNLIFNEGDPAMSEDGEIFFNTNAGLLHFNPDEISNSPFVPKIHVSSCRVSGERHDIRDDEPITINNRDKLSLRISAIDLTAPERVLFFYRIDGLDDEWRRMDNNSYINIDRLKTGKYTLRVRSTNGDGLAVDNEKDIEIIVKPSLEVILYALTFVIALLATATLCFILWRKRGKKEEKETEETEENRFKNALIKYLEDNIDNSDFDISDMARDMNMSRSSLFGKSREAIGMAPVEYLRRIRFERAAQHIRQGELSISQIAYMTGFNNAHYFSAAFKKQFGMTPTEYRKTNRQA